MHALVDEQAAGRDGRSAALLHGRFEIVDSSRAPAGDHGTEQCAETVLLRITS
jgi:hypothetical protein